MARDWLAIRVELLGGGDAGDLWPPPGRDLIANRRHCFAELATAIDDAFARWDRSHLHTFDLSDGRALTGQVFVDDQPDGPPALIDSEHQLGSLVGCGDVFTYTFDLGDCWRHRCTVTADDIDPLEALGVPSPDKPFPCFGWGIIPDQYGRLWLGDDSESNPPPPPGHLATLVRYPDRVVAIAERQATVVLGFPS